MSTHANAFRPLVDLLIDRDFLPDLERKIEHCEKEYMLGCCLLGFMAPCMEYPLTPKEYQLQAWIIYSKLFPKQADYALRKMEEVTGRKCSQSVTPASTCPHA